ncbi:lytic murein transglycosylase [Mycobacterium sp. B14F4]|uniref:lytic transglycosylase domain-containing protein n=1 Tax=Mycobacterium sp. B14F4 TaxID=3153565 RepID=UPI00325E5DAD
MSTLVACSQPSKPSTPQTLTTAGPTTPSKAAHPERVLPPRTPTRPRLASNPARLADDLVFDERAVRNPSSSQSALTAAARRQQVAYRALGRHPEWDPIVRPRIPPWLRETYDRNVDARRQFTAMSKGRAHATLPAWRIHPPAPIDELLGYYRKAESASGVGWNYLAAINLVETAFGRIAGVSTAGARGPMQFMPSTFAAYGGGGDIDSPHDSVMAAGRYLAANGFARDRDYALYRYNNSSQYVRAVNHYAAVIAASPAAFAGCYWWDVYYNSTAGDVLLPIGYSATSPIPVADYLASHPQ